MKNLKQLSDSGLYDRTKEKVKEERSITVEVLQLLREVERRRNFMGWSSLHEYCVKELKYSDPAAQRRISAMRLLKELPEIEEPLKDGSLNLSTVCADQVFFRAEKKEMKSFSIEEKQELVKTLEGKSVRETTKTLLGLSSNPQIFKENQKTVSPTQTQITLIVDEETFNLLQRIKELKSHTMPTTSEIFKEGLRLQLQKLDPMKQSQKVNSRGEPTPVKQCIIKNDKHKSGRYIPPKIKREVFARDGGKCTFLDPLTKRRCESKWRKRIPRT